MAPRKAKTEPAAATKKTRRRAAAAPQETGPRIGRQQPTRSMVVPYTQSRGAEALDLYRATGNAPYDWQSQQVYDILALNADGQWAHTQYGLSVPRRNGKNEVVLMVEMLALQDGRNVLHTAHRTTTTHKAYERLESALTRAGIITSRTYQALGRERLELGTGGVIEFRTRTSKGGLGEGFDLLVIDEAQEYETDQESALKYVVTDSDNPQTIFIGTPPTATSTGTVFPAFRADVLSGGRDHAGWAEWGVDKETDPKNRDAWYEANPSLGLKLTERAVVDEITSDALDFNIQRLGYWVRSNQKSAISRATWEGLACDELPTLRGKLFVGIKYSHEGDTVSLAVAVKTYTPDLVFVEAVDCRSTREGSRWIINFLTSVGDGAKKVVVDGANGQELLATAMKAAKLHKPVMPTVKQIIAANAAFTEAIDTHAITHKNQPSLAQAVSNCERRKIGTSGGFGYRSIKDGVDGSLLDAVILAYWAAKNDGEKAKRQHVGY